MKSYFLACFTKVTKPIPLVYPQSMFKIMWDTVLSLVLICFFLFIPIEVAFDNGLVFREYLGVTMSFIAFLVLDYFIKMNTVYYEFG